MLRGIAPALSGALACALLIRMAFQGGGYFPEHHLTEAAIAFAGLALLLLVRPPAFRISTPTLIAVCALAGLAGWTALSSHWSSAPDVALEDFQRDLLYLGIFGLGLLAAGSGRYSRHLVWAVLTVIAVVAVAGLLSRIRPDWVNGIAGYSRFSGYRLGWPLNYWNSFGAIGAMGVVLGAGLAGDPRSNVILRALAASSTIPIGAAAYLSFSRGAWLAFFFGIAVLLLMSAHRPSLLASLAICGVGLLVAVARLGALPALTESPDVGEGQLVTGQGYFVFLLGLMAAAAATQAVISGRWLPEEVRDAGRMLARPVGIGVMTLLLLAGGAVYALRSGDVEGGTAERLERAERWLDRQWDEFMAPAAFTAEGAERLTTARGTRSDLYRVAIDGFEDRPLRGDGAGGYEYRFAHERDVPEKVRDAHSIYFETLGELGLPGALLLLAFLGAVVWAAVVARMRRTALSGSQTAAAAGAFAVWMFHAGVDWDWQMPALTGTALVLAAAVFPPGRGLRRRRSAHRPDPLAQTMQRRFGHRAR